MKPVVLGALVGAGVGAMVLWSCTVHRASDNYKCEVQSDCASDRICMQGYCVLGTPIDAPRPIDAAVCPAVCGGTCDFTKAQCTITGTGTGNITCPAGWNCIINCPTSGACGMINCTMALSCDVNCTADNACLNVQCNTKPCDVECTGAHACGSITCTTGNCTAACTGGSACGAIGCSSGNCTETCNGGFGSNACGSLSCSTTGNCTANCMGSNACGNVQCNSGDCTTTCTGGIAACGTLNCGTGICAATCGSTAACGTINCLNSCKCDVTCDPTMGQCPAMTCPDPNGPAICTDAQGRCNSSIANQCISC